MPKLVIHREYELPEGMNVPDFNGVFDIMMKELIDKFPYYGNSFEDAEHDFWTERIGLEFEEYVKAPDAVIRLRKAANLANLAIMAANTELEDADVKLLKIGAR